MTFIYRDEVAALEKEHRQIQLDILPNLSIPARIRMSSQSGPLNDKRLAIPLNVLSDNLDFVEGVEWIHVSRK